MSLSPSQEGGADSPGTGGFWGAITERGQSLLGLDPEIQGKFLLSALALFAVWLIRRLVLRLAEGRLQDPKVRYQWSKTSGYVAFVFIVLLLGQIWLEAIRNMGTFLGLLSAGLAIALRDLVANMAGWGFILLRHPFVVGDRIQVGEHRGDVVDIRLFQFTLLEIGNWVDADQSTGRVIHIPNSRVFSDPLSNYTAEFPYLWHEIPVLVTFESDWREAKRILETAAREHADPILRDAEDRIRQASRKFLIYRGKLTPKVYTSVMESGVLLTIRILAPVRQRRGLAEALWESILDEFRRSPQVDLAYPTRRIYTNLLEGKAEIRAPWPSGMEPGRSEEGS